MLVPRLPGEPPDAYASFVVWLDQTPRPPPDPALAGLWDWGARARAHDATRDAPPRPLDAAHRDLSDLVALEASKFLQASRGTGVNVLRPRELVQVYAILKDVRPPQDGAVTLDDWPTEDLEALDELLSRARVKT